MNRLSNKRMSDNMNSKIRFNMQKSIIKRVIDNSIISNTHDVMRPCKLAGKLIFVHGYIIILCMINCIEKLTANMLDIFQRVIKRVS